MSEISFQQNVYTKKSLKTLYWILGQYILIPQRHTDLRTPCQRDSIIKSFIVKYTKIKNDSKFMNKV